MTKQLSQKLFFFLVKKALMTGSHVFPQGKTSLSIFSGNNNLIISLQDIDLDIDWEITYLAVFQI